MSALYIFQQTILCNKKKYIVEQQFLLYAFAGAFAYYDSLGLP